MPKRKVLFLTLKVFSATGGIEKVCKIAGKSLYETYGNDAYVFSMYDNDSFLQPAYFPSNIFKGFAGNKIRFVLSAVRNGIKSKVVILSHINLITVGFLIKLISPKTKLILYAHGVEIWNFLPASKISMLGKCDKIIAVSNYTKLQIKKLYGIDDKCIVLNNCLDPYLPPVSATGQAVLRKKYDLQSRDFILLTITRLSAEEQYKGHEKVIEAMADIIDDYPHLLYLVGGKYDTSEKQRLDALILEKNLSGKVIFTGYIPDEDLAAHYSLADVYIMPSFGEGFGIVFIEAMFYDLPVIAGNKDGSVDALQNGSLGLLVDPFSVSDIAKAIKLIINKKEGKPSRELLMEKFSYSKYKMQLKNILDAYC